MAFAEQPFHLSMLGNKGEKKMPWKHNGVIIKREKVGQMELINILILGKCLVRPR